MAAKRDGPVCTQDNQIFPVHSGSRAFVVSEITEEEEEEQLSNGDQGRTVDRTTHEHPLDRQYGELYIQQWNMRIKTTHN